jgi:hypothetical protein
MSNIDVPHGDEPADRAPTPDDALVESMLRGRPGPLRSLVAACRHRQQLFKRLIDWRHTVTTQEAVAAAMQTSQSAVARLEKGGGDPKISTLERMPRRSARRCTGRSPRTSRRWPTPRISTPGRCGGRA